MLALETRNSFRKDWKRIQKGGFNKAKLDEVVSLLLSEQALPLRCRPHKLSGNWENHWECHITPDTLLIYKTENNTLTLYHIGSHSELF